MSTLPQAAYEFGGYRPFLGKDEFPGLPPKAKPLLIKHTEQYILLFATMKDQMYIFGWDKVSPTYNFYEGIGYIHPIGAKQ